MNQSSRALAAAAAVLTLAGTAPAQASEALARANNCMSCHTVNKRVVGPSFKEIAAKYRGQGAAAEAALEKKVKLGGSGSFGAVPMPPNANVSDADVKTLVRWILAQ